MIDVAKCESTEISQLLNQNSETQLKTIEVYFKYELWYRS